MAGIPQQDVAGHVSQNGGTEVVLPVRRRGALVGRQELRGRDLHGHAGLLCRHLGGFLAIVPGDHRPALPG